MDLNEISELVKSPVFWFATVFVSLLVSIVGNFLYARFQNLWAKFSTRQAEKNTAKQKAFHDLVTEAHRKGIKVSDMEIHAIYLTLWNLLFLIAIFIVILLLEAISKNSLVSQTIVVILWLVLILIANRSINSASYDRKLIEAVRKSYSSESNDQVDDE